MLKSSDFTPKPGDIFTWHYDYNNEKLPDDCQIWLSDQRIYVPSFGINLLISLTETDIWWINSQSFFQARRDEMNPWTSGTSAAGFIHARVDEMRPIPHRDMHRKPFHPRSRG